MHMKKIRMIMERLKDGLKDAWDEIEDAEMLQADDKLRKHLIDRAKERLNMFEEDMGIYKELCKEHIDGYKNKERETKEGREMEKDMYSLTRCHEAHLEEEYRELKYHLSMIK